MDIFSKPQTLRQRLTATMLASSLVLTSFSALVALEAASPGVALAEVSIPSISNIPSSASVGQSFSPLVDRGSSSADVSVSSSTPLICTVAPGGVAYLAPGTCSLTSHLALSQSSIGSGFASSSFGPMGVAVDTSGHVFVADTGNNRIVKMDADGANQSTIASGHPVMSSWPTRVITASSRWTPPAPTKAPSDLGSVSPGLSPLMIAVTFLWLILPTAESCVWTPAASTWA
ncbi:MAG: hypothetical protein NT160_06670 [Actinobacteria bacterium]|nr:hypothetical protein [Actinomycetota bacterium]